MNVVIRNNNQARISPIGALAVLLSALLICSSPPSATAAGTPTSTFINKVSGAAVVVGSTCPFTDELPPVTVECRDWRVTLFKEDIPKLVRESSWGVDLQLVDVLVHPDGSVEEISVVTGLTYELESVTFDTRHLKTASVRAVVPMSDGTRRSVDLRWDGTSSPRVVAGNYGPYSVNNDIPRHHVDRCGTFNFHSHQTYRANVQIEGTIDGVDVGSMPYFEPFDPFISRAVYKVVDAHHGGPSC